MHTSTVTRVLMLLALLSVSACETVSSEGLSHAGPRGVAARMVLGAEPARSSIPYDRLLNSRGEVNDNEDFAAWVQRAEHVEAVYAEAGRGDARAIKVVQHLEKTFADAGDAVAVQVTVPRCLALQELQPGCHPDWTNLGFLGQAPGGRRLKALAFEAYEKRLHELEKRNRLTLAVFNALMAGMVWERTVAGMAAEEGTAMRHGLPPGQATTFKEGLTDLAAFVNEAEGLTPEVLEAKLAEVEATAPGPRLAPDLEALERTRPLVERPPAGVDAGDPLWRRYVLYYEERLAELKRAPAGKAPKPPRSWEGYRKLRQDFSRGLAFQQARAQALQSDAALLSQKDRKWLGAFTRARVEQNVGVKKVDLRYVDVFVYEVEPGLPRRVECFSFKSCDFEKIPGEEWKAQIRADVTEAKQYYGGELEIRRPAIKELYGQRVKVDKIHVVYDAKFKPNVPPNDLKRLLEQILSDNGVEVHFE